MKTKSSPAVSLQSSVASAVVTLVLTACGVLGTSSHASAQAGLGSSSPAATTRVPVISQPAPVLGYLMQVWGHGAGDATGAFIGEVQGSANHKQARLFAALDKWLRGKESRGAVARHEQGKSVIVRGKLLSARQRGLQGGVVLFGATGTNIESQLLAFHRGDISEDEFLSYISGFAIAGADGTFQSTPLRRGVQYSTIAWASGYRAEAARLTVLPADPARIDMVAFHLPSISTYANYRR